MATQVKEKAAGKHDAFIEAQLARAQDRIRFLDLTTAGLGLLAGTLAFTAFMVLLDRRFVLSDGARQLGLLAYLAGAGTYAAFFIVGPLRWRVNPYYAARRLEQTLPGSRNHVVNWIDLRGEKVPAVLKQSLGQRAAKDLSKADLERAISNRRAATAGGAAGALAALVVGLFFAFGPGPFASLLGRTFRPFGSAAIASRTQVKVVRPEGGDAVVTIGNPLTIEAEVTGRTPAVRDPDAPCLLYRHDPAEPYRKRFLLADESNRVWTTSVSPMDVGEGFFYKVAAGDAVTPEYRVGVRAAPLISDFEATYRYRDYVGRVDHTRTSRKLEDLRGTEVRIRARTNRVVKEGRLDFNGADGVGELVRARPVADDPQALAFVLVLDRPGKYSLRFTSADGEAYADRTAYEVNVLPDLPPTVRLTAPAKDVTLPANGHLELKGEAADDFGVARLTLRVQVVGGPKLKARPYLADKLGQANYGTPRAVDYQDLLELTALRDLKGQAVELKPGAQVEYWLEAADACDYHQPNVTASRPRYKITIAGATNDAREQKAKEEARKRQQEHDKQQAQQLKQEQQRRAEQKAKEQAQEKADQEQRAKERAGAGQKNGPTKEDKQGEKKPEPGSQGEPKKEPNPAQEKKDDETRKQADKLEKELKKQQEKDGGKGKEGGDKKGGKDEKGKAGGGSGAGGPDASKDPPGGKKDGGKPGPDSKDKGSGAGQPDPKEKPGKGKEGEKGGGAEGGPGKEGPGGKPNPGSGKDPGKGAAAKKPEKDPKPGDRVREGDGRNDKVSGRPTDLKPNEGKPGVKDNPKPDPGKGNGAKPGDLKAGQGPKGGDTAGQPKPAGGEPGTKPGEKAPGERKGPRPEDATPKDVSDLLRAIKETAGKGREQAKRDLQDVREKARDPKAREEAKKGLEQLGKEGAPGPEKPGPTGGTGEKKGPKPGEGGKDPADGPPGKGGKPSPEEGGKKAEGDGPGRGKKPGDKTGDGPGEGGKDRRPAAGGGGGAETPARPEKPAAHRASMLQLEEFRKKVDRDVLKEMKMSREQFEKFLRDYADLAKRETKPKAALPEKVAAPQHGGPLPSIAGRTSTKTGGTSDVRGEGRPKPPPGYDDAYRKFLQGLNEAPK
jgi:hypothetical protein